MKPSSLFYHFASPLSEGNIFFLLFYLNFNQVVINLRMNEDITENFLVFKEYVVLNKHETVKNALATNDSILVVLG